MFRLLYSAFAASLAAAAAPRGIQAQAAPHAAPIHSVHLQRSGAGLSLTLYGGFEGAEDTWETGPAVAASLNWRLRAPLSVRVDPYFAYHSGAGTDDNLTFLGATGNLEFAFRASGTTTEPYVFGGAGFYRAKIDGRRGGDLDLNENDVKSVVGVGAGMRSRGFTLEGRLQNVAEFTSFTFLVGFRLGG
ncbi:MAG: hypothetical protein ACRENH_12940 [Gemmatimonadaceae bacterium]